MIVTCPHCRQRVWPTAANSCPACRGTISSVETPVTADVVEAAPTPYGGRVPHLDDNEENPYAAPQVAEYVAHPAEDPRGAQGLWRCGKLLVIRRGAELPDRCIKTNLPAHGQRLKRKLAWHEPWIALLILAGLLIYVIVAMIVTKRATIYIGLCEAWFARRRRDILIAWVAVLSGAGLVAYDIARLANPVTPAAGTLMALGFLVLLTGAIYGLLRARMITPTRIDDHCVWVRGAGQDFLRELPEWPYPRP